MKFNHAARVSELVLKANPLVHHLYLIGLRSIYLMAVLIFKVNSVHEFCQSFKYSSSMAAVLILNLGFIAESLHFETALRPFPRPVPVFRGVVPSLELPFLTVGMRLRLP
jgi:hypothetical protein